MQDVHWLTSQTPEQVEDLLVQAGLLEAGAPLTSLRPAGEGNMNVTLRAEYAGGSVIVKQSRPFVAKYESIAAPLDRVRFEARFYEFASTVPDIASGMPRVLASFPEQYILVLEDIGRDLDAMRLYQLPSSSLSSPQLDQQFSQLSHWLRSLHDSSRNQDLCGFENRPLRMLNHTHIFQIPFSDPPAVDLDAVCDGLVHASHAVRTDIALRRRCHLLGEIYLGGGECLLHGDFYPGSWLLAPPGTADARPVVIDPEFCYAGPPEFDWGIFVAHLRLLGKIAFVERLQDELTELDWKLAEDLAAVEILRRLLGVAQLPLSLGLAERVHLLEWAYTQLSSS